MPIAEDQWGVTYPTPYDPRYVSKNCLAKGSTMESMNLVICSIRGYVGVKDVVQILLDGLERLE
jgi:hypothetical protein